MKPSDNFASDSDKTLSTEEGTLIELDTPAFLNWLESHDSFRFQSGIAGVNSYRARKEKINYWYAIKKVNGKLHKHFIGKSGEVTHSRLLEVADKIMQPPKPRDIQPVTVTPTQSIQPTLISDEIAKIWEAIQELREERREPGKSPKVNKDLEEEIRLLKLENQRLIEHTRSDELEEGSTEAKSLDIASDKEIELTHEINRLTEELKKPQIQPDYDKIRDLVLAKLKVGVQSSAGKAINLFIKELDKTSTNTPEIQQWKVGDRVDVTMPSGIVVSNGEIVSLFDDTCKVLWRDTNTHLLIQLSRLSAPSSSKPKELASIPARPNEDLTPIAAPYVDEVMKTFKETSDRNRVENELGKIAVFCGLKLVRDPKYSGNWSLLPLSGSLPQRRLITGDFYTIAQYLRDQHFLPNRQYAR
jgi:hypothetical protein